MDVVRISEIHRRARSDNPRLAGQGNTALTVTPATELRGEM